MCRCAFSELDVREAVNVCALGAKLPPAPAVLY